MKRLQRSFLVLGVLGVGAWPALARPDGHQDKGKGGDSKPAAKPDPKPAAPAAKHAAIGDEVDGALTLTDTDGKTHTLKDYRGKTVVLAMWSVDCPTCKGYQHKLDQLSADYGAKNVVVIAVDPNASEADHMKDAATKAGLKEPLMSDTGDKLTMALGAQTTPELFVLDAKGILRYRGAIDDDAKGEKADKANPYARHALDELVAGKPVTMATTSVTGSPIKTGAPPAKKPDEKPAPKKDGDKPPKKN